MTRVAIVGSGVSGLVCAHRLHRRYDITLFEAADHVGGHVRTLEVADRDRMQRVDTGFIVFNEARYPHFVNLLDELGVGSKPTSMSFSVQCERTGLEYCGTSWGTLFAQRRNLVRPRFYRLLAEIVRFNRIARGWLSDGAEPDLPLGELLARHRFSRDLVELYLVPMVAAIWSSSPSRLLADPAAFFLRFLDNHQLLSTGDHHTWRVIEGGSRTYVDRLIRPFADRVRLGTPVTAVTRRSSGVDVVTARHGRESFDEVILAVHSDQALAMLSPPTQAERQVLSAIAYQRNPAQLHTDLGQLPRARRAWASWNYHRPVRDADAVRVTYDMNRLQGLPGPRRYLVSLNRAAHVASDKVLAELEFEHPIFSPAAVAAQGRWREVSGVDGIHYCGAYWGHGFHEDGVVSGLAVSHDFESGRVAVPEVTV